jgi:DNA-binding SARP family transcriptional activator
MKFRLLGPIQGMSADRTIALGPPKQRLILASLLLDAGQVVPMQTLIDRAWHEGGPARVRASMYAYITRLRAVLEDVQGVQGGQGETGRTLLTGVAGGYRLNVDPESVDLHRFLGLVRRARTVTDDDGRCALLTEALQLWQGAPLSDLEGPWVGRVRTWLESERAQAVTEVAELHVRCGRSSEAITMLHAALTTQPTTEALAAGLIRAQVAGGWHAEALRTYATTRQGIICELGVEPGQQLRELHAMLLHPQRDGRRTADRVG